MNITIAIASNHPKNQLIQTIRSIRNCTGGESLPITVVCDSVPISPEVARQLRNYSVTYHELSVATSFAKKCKQLIELCRTDYILLTQDDVVFHRDTIKLVYRALKSSPHPTFVGVRNIPIPPTSLMERAISMGTLLSNRIARAWRNGENYMSCCGRVMAFPTNWATQLHIPENVVSLDAYLYLENKRRGGRYLCEWGARIYFKSPSTFSEHLSKSSRFQYSRLEMAAYGFERLRHEYAMPKGLALSQLASLFTRYPTQTVFYIFVFASTKLLRKSKEESLIAAWEADASTKSW